MMRKYVILKEEFCQSLFANTRTVCFKDIFRQGNIVSGSVGVGL